MSLLDRIRSYLTAPRAAANNPRPLLNTKAIANTRLVAGGPTVGEALTSAYKNNLVASMSRGDIFQNAPQINMAVNRVVRPAGQAAGGILEGLTGGLLNLNLAKPTNRIEQGANLAGNIVGFTAPIGFGAKVLSPVGRGVETALGKTLVSRGAGKLAQSALPVLAGEAAQTGTLALGSQLSGQNFNAGENLAFGLGSRGVLGTVGKVLGLKGVNPKAFDLHPDDAAELSAIGQKILRKAPLTKVEDETLQRTFKRLFPGYDLEKMSNAKIGKVIAATLDRYNQIPPGERESFPKLGLVADEPATRARQTFRTDKFNVNNRQRATLVNLQQALGLETRGVRSFDDMRAVAEELGTNPRKLLRDIESGRVTDSEVIALGNVIGQSSRRIASLSRQLKANPSDPKLLAQLEAEERLINQAIRKRIKGGTEAGRSVAAFRVIANQTMDPAYWLAKAKRQIGTEKDLPSDVVSAVNDFIAKNDRLGLARFVSKLGESSGWEKAITLWKAGLLTGVKTTVANVLGNTVMAGLETAKDLPAAGFDIARAALTGGTRAKTFGVRNLATQPGGFGEGAKRLVRMLREGSDPDEIAKAELRKPIRFGATRGGRFAQRYVDTVFGIVGGTDKPFYQAAFRRSLADQAGAVAKNTGRSVDEILANPTEEMLGTATRDAAYATFTSENALHNFIQAGKRASPAVGHVLDLVMPFVRTPTNVAKAAFIDYTPVGAVATVAKKLFNRQAVTDRELADALGRATTGTALLWLGGELAKRGLVSGPTPTGEAERAQWELEAKIPNAVFINGAWQNVSRLSPLGNLILLGAEAYKAGQEGEGIGGVAARTLAAGAKGFSEQSFLKGLSGGLSAVNDPSRSAGKYLESTISSSIPTFASDLARGSDPLRRDPEGVVERATNRLPGLRETLPAKLNSLGEPVREQGGLVGNLVNPFYSRQPSNDPLVAEFSRVGYNLNYVGDLKLGDAKAPRALQREYQRKAGQYIRDGLEAQIQTPEYQALSDDEKRYLIERTVDAAKRQAREELKLANPAVEERGGQVEAAAPAAESRFAGASPAQQAKENSAKLRLKTTGKPQRVGDKVFYLNENGNQATLDFGRVKGEAQGVAKYTRERERFSMARQIAGSEAFSDEEKDGYLQELGVDRRDAQYDYLAHQETAVKAGYLAEQLGGVEHDALLATLEDGRRESVSGTRVVSNAVLDELHDRGLISDEERKALKKVTGDGQARDGRGTGGTSARTLAAAVGKLRTTLVSNQPKDIQRPARVKQRGLGMTAAPSRRRGGTLVNAARLSSKQDIDALIRRYAGS